MARPFAASSADLAREIFHITHVSNLPRIIEIGGLYSDAECSAQGLAPTVIGYSHIKERRLKRSVKTSGGGCIGNYVPFNFCSRSVMLFVIHKGNTHPGGQREVVHLVSTIGAATQLGLPWLFTDRHADLDYAEHYEDIAELRNVDWSVMRRTYWNESIDTKEKRQAEFLVKDGFPWSAVHRVGVFDEDTAKIVRSHLAGADHQPAIAIEPSWYY